MYGEPDPGGVSRGKMQVKDTECCNLVSFYLHIHISPWRLHLDPDTLPLHFLSYHYSNVKKLATRQKAISESATVKPRTKLFHVQNQ